jgi:hypothetical protein
VSGSYGPEAERVTRADCSNSLHVRELRVIEEQAAIHRRFDHCVDAAQCLNGSNAQRAGFAKSATKDHVLDFLDAKLRLRIEAFETPVIDLWYRWRILP